MINDVLEKVKLLPVAQQEEVQDFIDFLVSRYVNERENSESLAEQRRRNMGWAKGQIWMADDFNDTPEDFKEYL